LFSGGATGMGWQKDCRTSGRSNSSEYVLFVIDFLKYIASSKNGVCGHWNNRSLKSRWLIQAGHI
jgi:hypothetical protein